MLFRWLCVSLLCAGPLAAEMKILAISGSTREESYNKKLLNEAALLAEQKGASVTFVDLKEYAMPFFDEDFEAEKGLPLNAQKLRQLLIEADGVMIASPEYNHSVSAILKNALDWISRKDKGFTRNAFEGKPFALMSASPGKKGGARGLMHLRDILEELHATLVPTQVSVGRFHEVLASKNGLKDASIAEPLRKEINELLGEK